MFRKPFTILLVPQGGNKVKSMKVSPGLLLTFLSIFVLGIGVIVFHIWGYYHKSLNEGELARLRAENQALIRRVGLMDVEADSLKHQIQLLIEHEEKLRMLADLPEIDEDIRKVGIGGTSSNPFHEDYALPPQVGYMTQTVHMDIDQLLREAEFTRASFQEIERKFRHQKRVLDHTPTIRPAKGFISSGFGFRRNPFTGRMSFHKGIDIVNRVGTPVYAPADGVVKYYGFLRNYGNLLIIDHGYGIRTYYAHLQHSFVRPGERVKRWQRIAAMGRTGRVTAPHLHYEVRVNRKAVNPINYFYADEVL